MRERFAWGDLPAAVQDAVQAHLGQVAVVREIEQGQNCNAALVLSCDQGDVFLKGVRGISPHMRWLRNESEAGDLAPGIAPATRFSEDIEADAAWFVVGFEYVNGRPADLSPGADDLASVATTVARINGLPGAAAQPLGKRWAPADWWTKLAAEAPDKVLGFDIDELTGWCRETPSLVEGTALLHTDLHEHQFMIDDDSSSVRVIDWGRPASGAAWVDAAFLVVRLIAAGHTAGEAEEWASTVPSWSTRTDKAVTAFACYVAGLWGYRAATTPFPGATRLAAAARQYAQYRLAS
ncbi:phosphotransferase family protein [Amycolatopsis sp. NPDC059090]|uniref:phosphotransferase family protein n=1 Tax=unclassified Amycolatopsis TaxID=2618356 RepID=UPI00366E33A2